MRYLITGGAGFIGSHLADYLTERGHSVVAFDNLTTGRVSNVEHLVGNEGFSLVEGDILDEEHLESAIRNVDQVYHLAAAVGVQRIMDEPVETIVTNVRGTENVLALCDRYRRKVLVASTSEVYGKLMESENTGELLREDGDWRLGATSKRRWAYACSKALDEFLALAYHSEKKLPVVVVRFFNTVGPRQTGRYGMVIPNFVQSALANEPIRVFGDGEQTRSFTYVSDAVHAITSLMQVREAEGEVFNVGSEEEISMNALAERVRTMSGSESPIVNVPYEEVYGPGFEDMRRRTPDLTRIRETIDYEPGYSVGDILTSTIAYFRSIEENRSYRMAVNSA